MELEDYTRELSERLRSAVALTDASAREVDDHLIEQLEPSLHLVMLRMLTEVADDVADATGVDVAVELRGGAPHLVTGPAAPPPSAAEENSARLTLRLPETVKADVEAAAARDGVSVNAYLVRAAQRSLAHDVRTAAHRGSTPPGTRSARPGVSSRLDGWYR